MAVSPMKSAANNNLTFLTEAGSYVDAGDESALIQQARQYSDQERKKSLKWFVTRGEPIPSKQDVQEIHEEREGVEAIRAAVARDVDRRRTVIEFGKYSSVPAEEHPGYSKEAADAANPEFHVTAASGIESRRRLHENFSSLCWTMLIRQRVEARLNRLSAKRAENMAPSPAPQLIAPGAAPQNRVPAKDATNVAPRNRRHKATIPAPCEIANRIAFLEMQSLIPDSEDDKVTIPQNRVAHTPAPATNQTAPSASTKADAKAAAQQQQQQPSPTTAAPSGLLSFPEPPSTTNIDVLKPKEMRMPYEFKLKDYKQQPLSDHPFATCDPPEQIALLPAGPREVAEVNSQAVVPCVTNFTQPVVTMETYPMAEFPFMRTEPKDRLIVGTAPAKVTDGGFKEKLVMPDHGQKIPSLHLCFGAATQQIFRDPLPATLKKPNPDDQLSDSDEENSEIPSIHPTSLVDLASTFLPPFRHNGEKVPAEQILDFTPNPIHSIANEKVNRSAAKRREGCEAFRQQMAKTLPQNLQLQF